MNPYEYRDEQELREDTPNGVIIMKREVWEAIAPERFKAPAAVPAIVYTGNALADQVIDDNGDLDDLTKQELEGLTDGTSGPGIGG